MFFEQTFKIFYDNGRCDETNDLLQYLRFQGISIESFYLRMKFLCKVTKNHYFYNSIYTYKWWTEDLFLYTENNMMVSPELFLSEYKKYTPKYSRKELKRRRSWDCRPRRNSHHETYYRDMETISERRAVVGVVKEEGEPEFRGSRRHLPNKWDEITARRSLSWKDCTKRKRQYKGS